MTLTRYRTTLKYLIEIAIFGFLLNNTEYSLELKNLDSENEKKKNVSAHL